MANFTNTTFSQTYWDDWDKNNGYQRILFNAGRSLQARELTQMQSILGGEIAALGNNLFKEGAAVSAGEISVNAAYKFVKVTTSVADVVIGETITQTSAPTGVAAIVLEKDTANNILYVRYTSDGNATIAAETIQFSLGASLNSPNAGALTVTSAGSGSDVGNACKVSVGEGKFWVMGHFVHSRQQSIILSPVPRNPANAVIGFKVIQEVITVNSDSDGNGYAIGSKLYDNWGGTFNTSAPGADRYRINLVLTEESALGVNDNFVFLARIENGKVTEQVQEVDAYNKINDLLAIRTKEESGDYIVNPFTLHYEDDNSADSDLTAVLSSGIAYVNGYRVEKQVPTKIRVPRPDKTEEINNGGIGVSYGGYVLCTMRSDLTSGAFPMAAPEVSSLQVVNLRDAFGPSGGSNRGTAVVTSITKGSVAGQFKVHLTNIQMDPGYSFRAVKSIFVSSALQMDVVLVSDPDGSYAKLEKGSNTSYLFRYPRPRPAIASASDISFTYRARTAAGETTNGSGVFSSLTGSLTDDLDASFSETYVDPETWIVYQDGFGIVDATVTIAPDGLSYSIQTPNNSTNTSVVLSIRRSAPVRKTKTLTQVTIAGGTGDWGPFTITGGKVELPYTDIVEVTAIQDASGVDITADFTLYNGQQDTHYELGQLILNSGIAHTGDVKVTYKYFAHSATGDYFDFASYPTYEEIPNHRLTTGQEISLRDYMDFRPDYNGVVWSMGGSGPSGPPANGSTINVDAKYYLGRADKVLLTEEGDVQILMGQQARDPQFKKTPDNSMELYKVLMNPYTISPSDLSIVPLEYKRYTMADIAKLESKLDRVEELSKLTALELSTHSHPFLDSDGAERPVSGSVTDQFQDHRSSDTKHTDYCASLDPQSQLIRPCFDEENLRLIYQADDGAVSGDPTYKNTSKNVIKGGDNVYINHTTAEWQKQTRASMGVKINKFDVVDNNGKLVLSPSSDEWKAAYWDASPAIAGTSRLSTRQQFLWNSWEWNWTGRSIEDEIVMYHPASLSTSLKREDVGGAGYRQLGLSPLLDIQSTTTTIPTNTTTNGAVNRIVSSDTLRSTANNRVVDIAIVPWLRSREIKFKAEGLKPNTSFNAFFDGINVTAWCDGSASFSRYSDGDEDYGNQYENLTGHPNVNPLTSDANGYLDGSFIIPNQRPVLTGIAYRNGSAQNQTTGLRFRAGVREFKLVDNTSGDVTNAGSIARAYYTVLGALENNRTGVSSTRAIEPSWSIHSPNSGASNRGNVQGGLNAKSVIDYLNGLSPSVIEMLEPHISGGWGPDTPEINPATNDLSGIISDYRDVDIAYFSPDATTTREIGNAESPFAQSFYVDNPHGLILKNVVLYFKQRPVSSTIPVTLEIRPMENGAPSVSQSVPGSTVVVQRDSISVDAETASSGTTFTFEEPVYLSPWSEYAICLKTQSSDYEIWVSSVGQFDVNDGKQITTSPIPGALFEPRHGGSYLSNEKDLKFIINRCVFDTNASLILRNSAVPSKLLLANPIRTTNLSSTIYIEHSCHGLHVGDTATISGATAVGGLTAGQINGSRAVTAIDGKGYQVVAGASATQTTKGGGSNVLSARNVNFDVFDAYIESVVPKHTSIDVSARFTKGRSVSDADATTAGKYVKETVYTRVTPRQNLEFNDYPRMIAMRSEETNSNGTSANGGSIASSSTYSLDVKVDLKSTNDYVSPVIDLQRCSAILIQNCIEDPSVTPAIYNVAETEATGGSGSARHISTPITLNDDAVGLDIQFDAQVPSLAGIETYYRIAEHGVDILDQDWVLVEPTTPVVKSNDPYDFYSNDFLAGGIGGTLDAFSQAQVKIVMNSTNSTQIPKIRDLRISAISI